MNTVTVATFNTAPPAEQLKEWLLGAGIPTKVSDQRILQRLWFLAKPYASFHLEVQKECYTKANALLSEWHNNKQALAEAIRCPMCASLRLQYPHMTRKFILPTLLAHLLTLVGISKHKFYCEDCHHTWSWPSKTGRLTVNLQH